MRVSISTYVPEPKETYFRTVLMSILGNIVNAVNRLADGMLFETTAIASGPYTMATTTSILLVDATSGAITVNLRDAAESPNRRLTIKKTDASANAVTVSGSGGQTIDGAASYSLPAQYRTVELIASGSNWLIAGVYP